MKLLAETTTPLGPIGGPGLGPFGEKVPGSGAQAIDAIARGVSALIGFLTIAASIWFLFQFLIGGIQWITSGGDKAGLESARNRLTHAFIGLIIVVIGYSIMAILGIFFGFNLLNPGENINVIQIKP